MAVAIPYIFYAATAASTYVAIDSSQKARTASHQIADANAAAALQAGEANARAAELSGQAQVTADKTQAQLQLAQANQQADDIRRKNARLAGTQRVAFLKSGVTLSGSAQDVMYDSALEGELDALNTRYTGQAGYTTYMNKAAYDKSTAEQTAANYRAGARTSASITKFEGNVKANAYNQQSYGSFFKGVSDAASGPSFG